MTVDSLLNTTELRIAAPSTVHLTCPRDKAALLILLRPFERASLESFSLYLTFSDTLESVCNRDVRTWLVELSGAIGFSGQKSYPDVAMDSSSDSELNGHSEDDSASEDVIYSELGVDLETDGTLASHLGLYLTGPSRNSAISMMS
jgi:hypothetical protein